LLLKLVLKGSLFVYPLLQQSIPVLLEAAVVIPQGFSASQRHEQRDEGSDQSGAEHSADDTTDDADVVL
jgi:hypothetical protein